MTDQELRKLKRPELLQIMIAQSKKITELQEKLEEAERRLADREIMLEESGNIAEAALRLNHIFEDAQRAAEQYLSNVQKHAARTFGEDAAFRETGAGRHDMAGKAKSVEETDKEESTKEEIWS